MTIILVTIVRVVTCIGLAAALVLAPYAIRVEYRNHHWRRVAIECYSLVLALGAFIAAWWVWTPTP